MRGGTYCMSSQHYRTTGGKSGMTSGTTAMIGQLTALSGDMSRTMGDISWMSTDGSSVMGLNTSLSTDGTSVRAGRTCRSGHGSERSSLGTCVRADRTYLRGSELISSPDERSRSEHGPLSSSYGCAFSMDGSGWSVLIHRMSFDGSAMSQFDPRPKIYYA
jgi:hypothetical protein